MINPGAVIETLNCELRRGDLFEMKVDVKQWLYIADFSYMFVHLIKEIYNAIGCSLKSKYVRLIAT